MTAIGRALALIAAAVALVALWAGFSTPGGRQFAGNVGDAGVSFGAWAGDQSGGLATLPTAGNFGVTVAVASVAFLLALVLVPALRAGRNFAIAAVVFTALGFLLYTPGLVG